MTGTRSSTLAGAWYAADPRELASAIDAHLAHAGPPGVWQGHLPIAAISPHAGHTWSGDGAAHIYRLLTGSAGKSIERVILIGPSHYQSFRGGSLLDVAAYETPLGSVPLDTMVVRALLEHPDFSTVPSAHRREHCIEIQLPFLQRVLSHPFRIVPILISQAEAESWSRMAAALVPYIDEHTFVLISSDFTHYGGRFEYLPFRDNPDLNLKRLDKGALEPILALDSAGLARFKAETGITVCGIRPIGVLLELLRSEALWALWGGRPQGRVLDYYRSADRTGDFDGSVSYAAVAFFRQRNLPAGPVYPEILRDVTVFGASTEQAQRDPGGDHAPNLTPEQERFLLELARHTLAEVLAGKPAPRVEVFPPGVDPARLRAVSGVFVTLTKDSRLRGCIGNIEGRESLVDGVISNAVSAALRDPRFPPVTADELANLEIEISVLTPLKRVDGPEAIEIGRHGVVLQKAGRRAVFLPQVAPEQGWDRDTTLDHLARKAGLPLEAWREGATFDIFEALVFSEKEHH